MTQHRFSHDEATRNHRWRNQSVQMSGDQPTFGMNCADGLKGTAGVMGREGGRGIAGGDGAEVAEDSLRNCPRQPGHRLTVMVERASFVESTQPAQRDRRKEVTVRNEGHPTDLRIEKIGSVEPAHDVGGFIEEWRHIFVPEVQ